MAWNKWTTFLFSSQAALHNTDETSNIFRQELFREVEADVFYSTSLSSSAGVSKVTIFWPPWPPWPLWSPPCSLHSRSLCRSRHIFIWARFMFWFSRTYFCFSRRPFPRFSCSWIFREYCSLLKTERFPIKYCVMMMVLLPWLWLDLVQNDVQPSKSVRDFKYPAEVESVRYRIIRFEYMPISTRYQIKLVMQHCLIFTEVFRKLHECLFIHTGSI